MSPLHRTICPLLGALALIMVVGCAATPTADSPAPHASAVAVAIAASAAPPTARPAAAAVTDTPPARSPTPQPTLAPLSSATRQQIFTEVWTTINENYLYKDFRDTDWSAVRSEFAPQVGATSSNEEFYRLISAMVERLGDNHSRFLPPSAAAQEDAMSSGRPEQVGIGVLTLPLADSLLIQHVFADSPAARAGLRPRDRIVAVDGEYYARRDIQGPQGSRVRLTVVRPGEQQGRDIVITRHHVEGRITPAVRRLPGDIGYVGVTTLWVSDMADQTAAALATIHTPRPLRGLILDLRGNPGGWRNVLVGVLSHFVAGPVGDFFSRKARNPLVIEPGAMPDLRGLPLVVLIDRGTNSYAELLAGILQYEAGATVIGQTSAGNTETIYSYELSGDTRLWVAQEGFELRDGTNLEGIGVRPDIMIEQDWTRFSEDDDPGIREARRLLVRQAGGKDETR